MAPRQESMRDFDRVRRKAFIQSMLRLFNRKSFDLLPFEEVRTQLRLRNRNYLGLRDIPLDQIVGSLGRYKDFTRTFLPKKDELRERWVNVEEKILEGGLPPIELFKVGNAYFVRDGNHRVSVARAQEAPTIEAYVWEYPSLIPLDPDTSLDDLLIKRGYVEFLEKTQLNTLYPNQTFELTVPGRYRDILIQIEAQRSLLNRKCGDEATYEEAVISWHDTIYQPIIDELQTQNILDRFPDRTETDLYIWISRWQHDLSK